MDIKEDQVRPQIPKLRIFHLCVNPSCQGYTPSKTISPASLGAYVELDLDVGVLVSSTGTGNWIRFTSTLVRDSGFVIELWEVGVS